jgi:hypothetical protein
VRALMHVATPAHDVLLLDHARLMTASQLEKLSRKYALVQRHGQSWSGPCSTTPRRNSLVNPTRLHTTIPRNHECRLCPSSQSPRCYSRSLVMNAQIPRNRTWRRPYPASPASPRSRCLVTSSPTGSTIPRNPSAATDAPDTTHRPPDGLRVPPSIRSLWHKVRASPRSTSRHTGRRLSHMNPDHELAEFYNSGNLRHLPVWCRRPDPGHLSEARRERA